jgi:argininosuccinate synthase
MAFAPDLEIIAPWRTWKLKSREDEIRYLRRRHIEAPMKKRDSYSRDDNLWHISHEGLELEDPSNVPNYKRMLKMTVPPERAPARGQELEIDFEKGIPVALNGRKMDGVALIANLNKIGGAHGVGLTDLVENRVVGMKSRGIYETPGGSILYYAHGELEHICLDRQTYGFKQQAALKMGELIYGGHWFTPLRESLSAFVDVTQRNVTGKVRLFLHRGNIRSAGVSSPYSLYNASIASFATGDLYNHGDAKGFVRLYGLPVLVRALMEKPSRAAKAGELIGSGKPGRARGSGARQAAKGGTRGRKPRGGGASGET